MLVSKRQREFFMLLCFCVFEVFPIKYNGTKIVYDTLTNCSEHPDVSCLTEKFAKAIDRAIDLDVDLFDGFVLTRNKNVILDSERSMFTFPSLRRSLLNFLDSHVVTLDLSRARGHAGGGGYESFGKVAKKEKKYLYYALTAVTAIFGLSVPIILSGLAIVAGKALIASKAALLIIGSIALKKIFQKDKESPIKVHTHTVSDDHDRYFDTSGYYNQYR